MRKLTGKWYIKKTFFGFKIMVEIVVDTFYPETMQMKFVKADKADLIELGINIY